MAIDNRYDEVVNGTTNFQKEGDSHVRSVKFYRQVKSQPGGSLPRHVPTSQKPTFKSYRQGKKSALEAVYHDTHRHVYEEVDQDSTEAAWRECYLEVNWMVTEADFQRRLLSQAACKSRFHILMTAGCCNGRGRAEVIWMLQD